MNEIAIPTASTDLVGFGSSSEAMERLARWVDAASNANRLVAPLVGSHFVPDAYKPKVDPRASDEDKAEAYRVAVANATAAVLQGLSIGLDPLVSLQQIYIVHGRPGMYTKIKVALVLAQGHEVWTEDLTDERAVVCGRRKGTDVAERVTITMEQAKKAGWTSNANYGKTPQDMLYARAAGRVCDRIASDVLMGIASVEEIQDAPDAAPQHPRVTAADILGPPPAPQDADQPATVEATPADQPAITHPQQRKLHALLKENELGNRADGLAYISGIVDRQVISTKDLTKAEAGTVIDRLETNLNVPEPPIDEAVAIALADDEPQLWPDTAQPGDQQ